MSASPHCKQLLRALDDHLEEAIVESMRNPGAISDRTQRANTMASFGEAIRQRLAHCLAAEDESADSNGAPTSNADIDPTATRLVAMVDQQDTALHWGIGAFDDNLTGHLVDAGTLGLVAKSARHADVNAALRAGLEELERDLLGRRCVLLSGKVVTIELMAVDCSNGNRSETIREWMTASSSQSRLIGLMARFIRARDKPIAEWVVKPGDLVGDEWIERDGRIVMLNYNYHLARFRQSVQLPAGTAGSFDEGVSWSEKLTEQWSSVTPELVYCTNNKRRVLEFEHKPGRDAEFLHVLACLPVVAMVASARTSHDGVHSAAPTAG